MCFQSFHGHACIKLLSGIYNYLSLPLLPLLETTVILASSPWAHLFPASGLGWSCSLPYNRVILTLNHSGLFPAWWECKCCCSCRLRGHVPAVFLRLWAGLRCTALWGRWSQAFPCKPVLHAKYETALPPSNGDPRGGILPRWGYSQYLLFALW